MPITNEGENQAANEAGELITKAFLDAITEVVEDEDLQAAIAKQAAVNLLEFTLEEMKQEIHGHRGTQAESAFDYPASGSSESGSIFGDKFPSAKTFWKDGPL